MPISLKMELDDGATVQIDFPTSVLNPDNDLTPGIVVTVKVTGRGDPTAPPHWTPKYRPEGEIKFNTSRSALREFMRNLEKLL